MEVEKIMQALEAKHPGVATSTSSHLQFLPRTTT